ncbi:NF-kappa-B-repressing factor [Nomia melanderi]|uniref:NF-kappa-B-repressing factor n=1 Tax=Nomia melanderi TaxID=2448451 RepID=UPI0013042481|nr:NF-kappa-B-repressing factor [Nomia melanderi]
MCSEQNWDVETHKTEHECDEHWELKRKFLLAHKDKFSEDELICLAQVFTNVELLGCRYPEETMELIADLGRDIISDYREKQKNKLKRTFIKASSAASLKVKGKTAPTSINKGQTETNLTRSSTDLNAGQVSVKRRKVQDHPFGDIVLIDRPDDIPQNALAWAINASGGNLEWKFDRAGDSSKCSILVNSKLLAEATSANQKLAKKEASIAGLQKLQKYYYTIKIKHNVSTNASVTTTTMLKDSSKDDSISDDNIGKKLMKLMGWTGGGLGKSQQGIVEPVTIKQQISREGLGLKSNSCTMNDLKNKSKDIMRKYLAGDMKNDLVFSADFTNDERAIIHQVARQMGLKSHSYGPKNQRTMVVSRKIDVRDLVEELKSLGGTTNKYELIEPTEL